MRISRKKLEDRHIALKAARSTYMSDWKDLSAMFSPARGRWNNAVEKSRAKDFLEVIDNTPFLSRRTMASGLMSGMTSPARPWFKLMAGNEELDDIPSVKRWMDDETRAMRQLFASTNTYHLLHHLYEEMATFGLGGAFLMGDAGRVMHGHGLTAGEYCIATDSKGKVNTVYREFRYTVGQMAARFGANTLSPSVKNMYDRHKMDQTVPIVHAVQPRAQRIITSRSNLDMPFEAIYFEMGSTADNVLEETGHEIFPGLFPRWQTIGNSAYGTAPALEALGDARALQHAQLAKGMAIDNAVDPELLVPDHMINKFRKRAKGKAYAYSPTEGSARDAQVHQLITAQVDYQPLLEDIYDTRERVSKALYADLFAMMLGQKERTPVTATQVDAEQEERLLMLGPVVESLQDGMLRPLIDLAFHYRQEAGLVAEPPPELVDGMELEVSYTSVLAQAQQMIGIGAIERAMQMMAGMAQLNPEALDKLNTDSMVDDYTDMVGLDPDNVRSNEETQAIRDQRRQQQQVQQAAELAATAAPAITALSNTSESDRSAIDQLTGYT